MENLNNVPSTGTFGGSINQVNQNFGLVKDAIENVEGRTIRSKGLFPTQAALIAAYPSPKVGDYAYVGSSLPATIYDCEVEGTWHNTQQQGGSESVPLNNYPTKSEMNAAIAAIEIETVDNLNEETAASGKALDAHQGFVLAGQIGDVQEEMNESIVNSLERGFAEKIITLGAPISFFISPGGKTWSTSTSSHYIIAIKPYDTFKITANANHVSDFAFLTRNDYPVDGEQAPISTIDNTVHRINAGEYKYATAPADAKYLYIWGTHRGTVYDPQSIIKYVDENERDNVVDGIFDSLYNFEPVTGLTERNGFAVSATASWVNVTSSNYKHKYIAREQSWKRIKVKANNTSSALFFFTTSNQTPANQTPLPLCSGTYTNVVAAGTTQEFYIPDDCKYIIFDTKSSSSDYTPEIIEVNGESVCELLSEETPVDFDDYEELLGWINGTGDYLSTAGSGHYVIDVRGYDKVTGLANAVNDSYFVLASAVNGNNWTKVGGRIPKASNTAFEFYTNGAPYLIVGNYSSQANRDNANSVLPQSLSLVSSDRIGTLENRVEKLEDGGIGQTDIISLNGKAELDAMFKAATRADRTVTSGGITTETAPVVFLHFSDLHGNESNLVRIVSLYNAYSEYINDVINTGDNITNTFNDSFAFYASRGAGGFLNVIGNHDAQKGSNSYATEAELYAKFIGPFISQWGVTSYTENKCYYYKDYEDSNLRLIVLDAYNVNWNSNNAQITWLESVLADAITNELHVMIAVHSGLCRKSDLDCNFNSMQTRWSWLGSNDNVVTWQGQVDGYLGSVVDTFIQNRGKFICWLSGHTHCDVMGFGERHPNQMTINIGSSGNMELVNRASDIERVEDTKSQDCVNMVVVDTFKKQLKLYRIGGDIDRYFRSRKALVYDYDNREVIYQR